jgi:hypothetical protein
LQSVSWRSTLPEALFSEPALPNEHFVRKLTTIFTGHRSLNRFHQGCRSTSVPGELLRAINDLNASLFAQILVVSAFVNVLEAIPSTDVIHKNEAELVGTRLDVLKEVKQSWPTLHTALARILVRRDDSDALFLREIGDRQLLIFG